LGSEFINFTIHGKNFPKGKPSIEVWVISKISCSRGSRDNKLSLISVLIHKNLGLGNRLESFAERKIECNIGYDCFKHRLRIEEVLFAFCARFGLFLPNPFQQKYS